MTPQAARPADPALLHFAMLADRLTDAAIREDMVQTLISTADLDRMARSLGPDQREAAIHARKLVAQAIEVLENALARGMATARRDPRQAAYVTAGAA
ncbi:MAG: hypothetical protein Q27BPR15_03690 [Rhodobacter sp. CACIA14H1]|nr:MAG: hypothetical protein Q27BPR15_03690 [Rhodobacter sp. CACIA14H1]